MTAPSITLIGSPGTDLLSEVISYICKEAPSLLLPLDPAQSQANEYPLDRFVPALIAGLGASDSNDRSIARLSLLGLGSIADGEKNAAMIQKLVFDLECEALEDPNPLVRQQVVALLASQSRCPKPVVPTLLCAARDDDANVRRAVISKLCDFDLRSDTEATLSTLIPLMKDEDARVRREAVKCLSSCDVDQVVKVLFKIRDAILDSDAGVRKEAASTIAWLGYDATSAVPWLLDAILNDDDERVQEEYARALVKIDPEGEQVIANSLLTNCESRNRLVEKLHCLGRDGRRLRHKLQAYQPIKVARSVERMIIISSGGNDYTLRADDNQPVSIPRGGVFGRIFALLVAKVWVGAPNEVVEWQGVNSEFSKDNKSKKGLGAVRQLLHRANKDLVKELGPPPSAKYWIVTVKGRGIRLNSSVQWVLSEELNKEFGSHSVYTKPWDPQIVAETYFERGQKLPSRSRVEGKRKADKDD